MLERKAYQRLLEWKRTSAGSTALLVEGARRVGKTSLVEEFGRQEYETCLVIDFTKASPALKSYFEEYLGDLDTFFTYLVAETHVELKRRRSLVIFDEVQAFPPARQAIKHLVAGGRFDYIETGSLISIRKNVAGIVIPSEEERLRLDPFDFEEFLWALGERPLAELIKASRASLTPLPDGLHRKASRLLREYLLVGGMPQAVASYAEHHDLDRVERVKRGILSLYRDDIAKFAERDAARVRTAFDSIPTQLNRKTKRFTFSLVGSSESAQLEGAFDWLDDAFMVNRCFRCTAPSVDLASTAERDVYKCYLADTGLLVSQAFPEATLASGGVMADILQDRLSINEGMFVENLVAQCLRASGDPLYYWTHFDERRKRSYEVDFLLDRPMPGTAGGIGRMQVCAVEAKSSKRFGTRSLDVFDERLRDRRRAGPSYVLAPRQIAVGEGPHGRRITLPLYMAPWL